MGTMFPGGGRRSWDVIVAGCGPAGAVAGRELARRGFSVLILEEHREVGRPVQCAGLVTRRALREVPAGGAVLRSLGEAELISPSGRRVRIGGGGERAVVIDRAAYDKAAAEMAIDAGCELWLGARVTALAPLRSSGLRRRRRGGGAPGEPPEAGRGAGDGMEDGESGLRLTVRRGGNLEELEARAVVGADGVQSIVRRFLGAPPPPEILPGFEAELTGVEDDGAVRVLFGREVAPGFFAWLIPSGERGAVLGLCCEPGPVPARMYLERLRRSPLLAPLIGRASVLRYMAGSVPLGTVSRTYGDGALLAGDAAGQVKPVTGGGLYTGTTCARVAAECLAGALERGDCSARALAVYEKAWRRELGRELRIGRMLRRAFVNVTDAQMDELLGALDRPELLALVSARGDLDAPSELAKLLFRQAPGLLKFAGPLVKSLFK